MRFCVCLAVSCGAAAKDQYKCTSLLICSARVESFETLFTHIIQIIRSECTTNDLLKLIGGAQRMCYKQYVEVIKCMHSFVVNKEVLNFNEALQ